MKNHPRTIEIFKALGHPVRLEIVRKLGEEEICACEIASWFPSDRTTISKHIALLRDAGILSDRREGQRILYRVALPCVLETIKCIEKGMCSCGG